MERHPFHDLVHRRVAAGRAYLEFLRTADLSAGLYEIPAGGTDPQQPHTEDEVYVVMRGRARFTSGGITCDAAPGDLLFVPAREPHRFHDVTEDLSVLVVFGPAEHSRG